MIRFENELSDGGELPVEIFEQDTARAPVEVEEHWHDCFELLYVLCGEAEQWVNGARFRLCAGDILLLYSGDVHATRCMDGGRTRIFVLKFMPSILDARLSRPYTPVHLAGFLNREGRTAPLEPAHQAVIRPLLEELEAEYRRREPGYAFYIRSGILRLTGYFVRSGIIRTLSIDGPGPQAEWISRILRYMEEHYRDPLTLRDIAGMAHMNYSYASRYFKRLTGRNFKQYLDYIRVSEATLCLLEGTTVAETATRCGFSGPQAMARTYTRILGFPPTAIRSGGQTPAAK